MGLILAGIILLPIFAALGLLVIAAYVIAQREIAYDVLGALE